MNQKRQKKPIKRKITVLFLSNLKFAKKKKNFQFLLKKRIPNKLKMNPNKTFNNTK